jgi:short-subunit dehydrogenase
MALCPGVTETGFFAASHIQKPPARTSETPEQVVETALRGLRRRKSSIISGAPNKLMVATERVMPRSFVLRTIGLVMRGVGRAPG